MRKRVRIALCLMVGLGGLAVTGALVLHVCMRQVPSFYQAAIEQDEQTQAEANDECLRQAAALASDVHRPGQWQATFSSDQINGWLAVDLPQNYPGTLPPELEDPRVEIRRGLATLACRYKQGESDSVVSISFDLYLSAPNVIALRVRGVRAGLLPVPLSSVLDGISTAARNFDLELEWRQSHGDPVALVRLPPAYDEQSNEMRLDAIELRESLVYLAGRTVVAGEETLAADEPTEMPTEEALEELAEGKVQARSDAGSNETIQR